MTWQLVASSVGLLGFAAIVVILWTAPTNPDPRRKDDDPTSPFASYES